MCVVVVVCIEDIMNQEEVRKQVEHMVAFIYQEGKEKCNELQEKAQQDAADERSRLVAEGMKKLEEEFSRQKKKQETRKKIKESRVIKESRIQLLELREEKLQELKSSVRESLMRFTSNQGQYKELMRDLMVEAMEKLHEPSLQVVVRAEDQNIAKSVLKDAEKKYRERNDRSTELELSTKTIPNTENYPNAGGCILETKGGFIRVSNTLEDRLHIMFTDALPNIRGALF